MRRVQILSAAAALTTLIAGCGSSAGHSGSSSASGAATTGRPAPSTRPAPHTVSTGTTSTAAVPAGGGASAQATVAGVPHFAHILVVVEENHAQGEIIGSSAAPYMNYLARTGALLTHSYGVTHPSYPNYLALFSGSTHGISNDSCPHYYRSDNLGHQLRAKRLSFVGYADSLPQAGYRGCTAGAYARRHVPWVDFLDLPRSVNQPMTAFPRDYNRLPRVGFVIPDVNHDMHNGTIRQADTWLKSKLSGYVQWARTHNSLLILTWDEDDRSAGNRIATVLVGAHVKIAHFATRVDHYRVLRTIEAAYGLRPLGYAAQRSPLTTVWR